MNTDNYDEYGVNTKNSFNTPPQPPANTKDAALATLNKAAEQVYNIEGDQWQEAYETIEAVINKLNQQPNQH